MRTYNTVDEYLQNYKENDIIVLGGTNGLSFAIESKWDTYKVHRNTTKGKLVVRNYRGRTNLTLGANAYEQKVTVISKKEFEGLRV